MALRAGVQVRFLQLERGTPAWCQGCALPSALRVRWLVSRVLVCGDTETLVACQVVCTHACMDCGANTYVDVPEPEL